MLRRRTSGLFRRKKNASDGTENGQPGAGPGAGPAAHHAVLSSITEEEDVTAVLIESLTSRIDDLEHQRTGRDGQEARLRADVRNRDGQISRLRREIQEVQGRSESEKQQWLRERQELTRGHQETIRNKTATLSELEENLREYQRWSVRTVEEHQAKERIIAEKDQRIARLNSQVKSIVDVPDRPIAAARLEIFNLGEQIRELENEVDKRKAEHFTLQEEKVKLDKELAGMMRAAQMLEGENQQLQTVLADQKDEAEKLLLERACEYAADKEATLSLFGSITPRKVLMMKLLAPADRELTTSSAASVSELLQSGNSAGLSNQALDVGLDSQQATTLASFLGDDRAVQASLCLVACDLCHRSKFAQKGSGMSRFRVNEFSGLGNPTACCSKAVCSECYLEAVTRSLKSDWWFNLESSSWLKCPVSSCTEPIAITHRGALENLLRQLGDKDAPNNMAIYSRAVVLRSSLAGLSPTPDHDALTVASRLHAQLDTLGRMYSLFEPALAVTQPDETGRIPPFQPGQIRLLSVDHNGGSVSAPIFMRFLRRQAAAKECVVCTDEVFDVDFGSTQDWEDFCEGFKGDWMWKVLLFPEKLSRTCAHPIDFCTSCLQTHLSTQLEQYGRSRCDQLACPSAECGRQMDYEEIRLYAATETFTRYDHYLNLNTLSQFPNFRWCLREGCSSGQIYDLADGDADPRVFCEECRYEMCFAHSMPWHEGQTCEQYDSVREHGDPEFRQTREWISRNTKPCPRCNENIQKGEYCFHMTCSQCRHEYCWECLADWGQINPQPGEHNANAHAAGCPFRTSGVAPTQISGRTFAEAMGRRR